MGCTSSHPHADRFQVQHPDSSRGVAFAPNGSFFVTGCTDGVVRQWDAVTGRFEYAYEGQISPITSVAVSPDGVLIAATSCDGRTFVWPKENNNYTFFQNGYSQVRCVAFSPDSKYIAVGSIIGSVNIYSIERTTLCLEKWVCSGSAIHAIAYLPES